MSKIKKYDDGTYEIPQKFIDIVHLPLQSLLDVKGYKLKLPNKITEQGQNEIAEFLIGLGEEGLRLADFHKELQKHAWTYFHKSTGESRDRVFTLNLATQRIEPRDSEEGCGHNHGEHEDQFKNFLGKLLDHVGGELKKRKTINNIVTGDRSVVITDSSKEPDIFEKINRTIFKKK